MTVAFTSAVSILSMLMSVIIQCTCICAHGLLRVFTCTHVYVHVCRPYHWLLLSCAGEGEREGGRRGGDKDRKSGVEGGGGEGGGRGKE